MKRTIRMDTFVMFVAILYFAASFLTVAYSFAKYIMVVTAVLIALCAAWAHSGKIRVHLDAFHLFTVAFLLFCCSSTLWAMDRNLVIERVVLIAQILVVTFFVYLYYQEKPIDQLLKIAMFGGYAVSLVALADQGLGVYLNGILQGKRIYDDEYINANMIGMLMASTIVLNFYYILYKKKIKWWTVFTLPAFICLAGAASKKSILMLVGGCFLLVILHNFNSKKLMLSAVRVLFFALAFLVAVYLLSRIPAFKALNNRLELMLNFFTGQGESDYSTRERFAMLEAGVLIFKQKPLLGVGIDNPKLLNIRRVYLHNNYLELLAGGGVVGCGLYYSMYAYLLYNMFKYRARRNGEYDICLVLLLLHLVLEYGYVGYFNKETYFYFMMFFLEVRRLKRAAREQFMVTAGNQAARGLYGT